MGFNNELDTGLEDQRTYAPNDNYHFHELRIFLIIFLALNIGFFHFLTLHFRSSSNISQINAC